MPSFADARLTILKRHKKVKGPEPTECWIWQGAVSSTGYGSMSIAGKRYSPHAVAYQLWHGTPYPKWYSGYHLDHRCAVRLCVNPDHLEKVLIRENYMRGYSVNAAKTHCPQGHAYDAENTYWRTDKPFARECRACSLKRSAAFLLTPKRKAWEALNRDKINARRRKLYKLRRAA